MPSTTARLFALGFLLAGCTYDEPVTHIDIKGQVKLPKAAATFLYVDAKGQTVEIPDARAIGPVYLGVYPSVREGDFEYPHPEMGPIIVEEKPGDTYPYGGGTVGRLSWGCYESTICKTVTGRYSGFGDVLDWFNTQLGPLEDGTEFEVVDPYGEVVTNDEVYRERCYEVLYYTADYEVEFVPPSEDEEVVADYLDFHEEGDFFVADVELLHVKYVKGMQVWGWVDMPSTTYNFASCDPDNQTRYQDYYSEYYSMGTSYTDLLNFPSTYIDAGDWVADDSPHIDSMDSEFEVTLGYQYEG